MSMYYVQEYCGFSAGTTHPNSWQIWILFF